jgi:hypothetical protein
MEEVRLLAQGTSAQPYAEPNRGTDSVTSSDADSDSDAESRSSSGLSDAPLDRCEPPLTKIPRGLPRKKRMRKHEAHRERNKQVKEGRDEVPDRAPRRCGVCGGKDGHNARTCIRPHM